MSHILIYGAPGAGKTTLSKVLQSHLHTELFEGDYLREVTAQRDKTEEEDPFLHVGTKQAWRKFGSLSEENVVKGLKAVRSSLGPYVEAEINRHKDLIFEAAFIDPTYYESKAKLLLIVTLNEEKHRKHFFNHRVKSQETEEGFRAARLIQSYLIKESEKLNVTMIENEDKPETVIRQLL